MKRCFFPPLLFLAPFVAAYGAGRVWARVLLPDGVAMVVGPTLLVAGVVLEAWALGTLLRRRTSPAPWQPTTVLVTSGPYRWSRNPVYLADAVIYLGGALWVNSLPVLPGLPVAVALAQWLAIMPEERYLEGLFGRGYREYRKRVRRWL
jgi:protein-S-isoprenylcysteine O-methyltransferase Ste14